MEFSECIENVGTAETEKWFSLKSCLCSLKGTQLPDAQEGQKGAEGQTVQGTEVQKEKLLGRFSSRFSRNFEALSMSGEDTSCRITSRFPPAQLSTLLSKKAISWFIPCPDYWGRSGVRINVLQLWWGVEGVKHSEVSEQDTPPGNATRTQNSDYQAIERSFSAALCVHSAFLTALGELHLYRLFPRGLQGKCHENMVIDLSKDEPRETHRKGGQRNPKDKFIYLPGEGRGRVSRPVCSVWGRVCYQPVK